VLVSRRAAAEEAQRFGTGVPDFVLPAWRNRDRVSHFHLASFVFDAHAALTVRDVINFFSHFVIMLLSRAAGMNACFRETLISNGRVSVREEFANFGAIFSDERRDSFQVGDIHAL